MSLVSKQIEAKDGDLWCLETAHIPPKNKHSNIRSSDFVWNFHHWTTTSSQNESRQLFCNWWNAQSIGNSQNVQTTYSGNSFSIVNNFSETVQEKVINSRKGRLKFYHGVIDHQFHNQHWLQDVLQIIKLFAKVIPSLKQKSAISISILKLE